MIVIDYKTESFKDKAKTCVKKIPTFLKNYVCTIFPIFQWIHRYNTTWLVQDMIAGVTVGIVIVPQSMAYAKIAGLDPQYGLYSSFAGVTLYCLFGTSKDISVGPISTVSLLVGSVVHTITKMDLSTSPAEITTTLGLFTGIIMIFISLLRLGMLVDFIPEPAIAGYMTGSAITIILSQVPKLFGIADIATNRPPYLVLASILSHLSSTRLDIAFGLTALVFLYAVRYLCGRLKFNSAKTQKAVFLFNIMRNGLIVIFGTLVSFLISRGKDIFPISVIQSVPSGFDAMGVPRINWKVLQESGGILPSIVLILILEHISVAKSFGRIYEYQINPDQEILAMGICNAIGPFFGGYPSAGAFSRTAIMARSGSRTPMAGVFSGAVLILALYALTPAFHYIPDAILAAVVIHAVSDLASSIHYLKELWTVSFAEFVVWTSAVFVTIFVNVQTGIYAAFGLSLMLLLYRFSRPPIKTLTKVSISNNSHEKQKYVEEVELYVDEKDPNFKKHIVSLPSNILLLRLCDSILYPNAEYISDLIVHTVKSKTRGSNVDSNRSWNDHAPSNFENELKRFDVLKALVLDFGAVNRLDATSSQMLRVTRETIDKYTGGTVEWHFTNLQNASVRADLLHAGFGTLQSLDDQSMVSYKGSSCNADSTMILDEEEKVSVPVDKYPCFHWDINTAMKSINARLTHNLSGLKKLDTQTTIF